MSVSHALGRNSLTEFNCFFSSAILNPPGMAAQGAGDRQYGASTKSRETLKAKDGSSIGLSGTVR
jgi:hypothetical protein